MAAFVIRWRVTCELHSAVEKSHMRGRLKSLTLSRKALSLVMLQTVEECMYANASIGRRR